MKTILTIVAALVAGTTAVAQSCGSCTRTCEGSSCAMTTGAAQFDVRLATLARDTVDLGDVLSRGPAAILQLGPGAESDSAARMMERWSLLDVSIPVFGSLCSKDKKVRKHVAGLKLGYPVLLDPDGELLALCKTSECDPVLVIVGQGGDVVMTASDVTEEALDEGMRLLAESGRAIDPVCGMSVDKSAAAATSNYRDETWYFCSEACRKRFDKDPKKYLKD